MNFHSIPHSLYSIFESRYFQIQWYNWMTSIDFFHSNYSIKKEKKCFKFTNAMNKKLKQNTNIGLMFFSIFYKFTQSFILLQLNSALKHWTQCCSPFVFTLKIIKSILLEKILYNKITAIVNNQCSSYFEEVFSSSRIFIIEINMYILNKLHDPVLYIRLAIYFATISDDLLYNYTLYKRNIHKNLSLIIEWYKLNSIKFSISMWQRVYYGAPLEVPIYIISSWGLSVWYDWFFLNNFRTNYPILFAGSFQNENLYKVFFYVKKKIRRVEYRFSLYLFWILSSRFNSFSSPN